MAARQVMERFARLLLGTYFFGVGLFLLLAPWTGLWTMNWFVHHSGVLSGLLLSPWARGALSGVGVLYILGGLRETLRLAEERWEN